MFGGQSRWSEVHSRGLFAVNVLVVVIAQDARDATTTAFERTLQSTLGPGAELRIQRTPRDPPDDESMAAGAEGDGVVELTWSADHSRARLHCYVGRERRWLDREITFGGSVIDPKDEATERGRLLGFAVATMFAETAVEKPSPPRRVASSPAARRQERSHARSLEFAGIASSGLRGTAAGLGASAGARWQATGPLSLRGFVAGRAGNVPEAQASTQTAHVGAGVSWAFLPSTTSFELGVRADALLSYFQATHLSEDDVVPDTKSRWLPGFDGLLEGGVRFTGSAGLYAGMGIEAMVGATELYTHGRRVAIVPPLRMVGELGFRTRF